MNGLTDQQRYKQYCAWCIDMGIPPAPFAEWMRVNGGVGDHWGSIQKLNMGRAR